MSIVLDLIIVFIILLFIIMSARKGFVRTLIEVVGFIAAIAVALSISAPVSDFIYEKTVRPAINKSVESTIAEGASTTEEAIDSVLSKFPSFISNSEFLNNTKENLSQSATDAAINDSVALSNTVSDVFIKPPLIKLFSIFVSIILIIVLLIIVRILAKLINKLFSFSVVGKINKFLGGILGAVKGFGFAIVFCLVIGLVLSFTKDGFFFITQENIDSSYIFKFFMELAPFI